MTSIDFTFALNEYLSLKKEYDDQVRVFNHNMYGEMVQNPKQTKAKTSIKTKAIIKRTIPKVPKVPCVNCDRPVGTIFSTKQKTIGRILNAVCGDTLHPCNLHIELLMPTCTLLPEYLQTLRKEIAAVKTEIITIKNNLLFKYSSEEAAMDKFDKLRKTLSILVQEYEQAFSKYAEITDNTERIALYAKKVKEEEECRHAMKTMEPEEYVSTYNDILMPLSSECLILKYANVSMLQEDGRFILREVITDIPDMEWEITANGSKVIAFKRGA